MPFLFGVPSTFFIVNKMEVPEDVVFVNIDTGKVFHIYIISKLRLIGQMFCIKHQEI